MKLNKKTAVYTVISHFLLGKFLSVIFLGVVQYVEKE